jgi:hypothetical protein
MPPHHPRAIQSPRSRYAQALRPVAMVGTPIGDTSEPFRNSFSHSVERSRVVEGMLRQPRKGDGASTRTFRA